MKGGYKKNVDKTPIDQQPLFWSSAYVLTSVKKVILYFKKFQAV